MFYGTDDLYVTPIAEALNPLLNFRIRGSFVISPTMEIFGRTCDREEFGSVEERRDVFSEFGGVNLFDEVRIW